MKLLRKVSHNRLNHGQPKENLLTQTELQPDNGASSNINASLCAPTCYAPCWFCSKSLKKQIREHGFR